MALTVKKKRWKTVYCLSLTVVPEPIQVSAQSFDYDDLVLHPMVSTRWFTCSSRLQRKQVQESSNTGTVLVLVKYGHGKKGYFDHPVFIYVVVSESHHASPRVF